MALNLTRSFTYAPNATIASSENNTNENTLYNAFTGLEAGTSSMSKLPLDADPSSALHAATKQYVDVYANYRRPVLQYISATAVDIENNTGTANQTKIVFSDGNSRSVTEDTASANKYRRFDITATAEFTSGTEDSGLRSGLTEATNTWYVIYAVKSTINSANFVLAGDTTLPTQGNFSTLNTRYGANGWVYLGLIRNGDQGSTAGDVLDFNMAGHITHFNNTTTGANSQNSQGIIMATTASGNPLAWLYAGGTAGAVIPSIVKLGWWVVSSTRAASHTVDIVHGGAATTRYFSLDTVSGTSTFKVGLNNVTNGISVGVGAASPQDIILTGFVDSVLGVGSNPLL